MSERVAGLLLGCALQPVSRSVGLTADEVCHGDGKVLLRPGDPAVPLPAPFADLLLPLASNRANMVTAANRDPRWLLPGRRTGQPMLPSGHRPALRAHGIPVQNGRTAVRQLVLPAPAPVEPMPLAVTASAATSISAGSALGVSAADTKESLTSLASMREDAEQDLLSKEYHASFDSSDPVLDFTVPGRRGPGDMM